MNMKKMLIVIQLLGTSSLGVAQETPTKQKPSALYQEEISYDSPVRPAIESAPSPDLNETMGHPWQSPVAATAQPKKRVQPSASLPMNPLITPVKTKKRELESLSAANRINDAIAFDESQRQEAKKRHLYKQAELEEHEAELQKSEQESLEMFEQTEEGRQQKWEIRQAALQKALRDSLNYQQDNSAPLYLPPELVRNPSERGLYSTTQALHTSSEEEDNSLENHPFFKKTVYTGPALHKAVLDGKSQEVQRLLNTDIPINEKDMLGNTALHYVSRLDTASALPLTKMLLEKGANTTIKNTEGKNAYDLARAKYFSLFALLHQDELPENNNVTNGITTTFLSGKNSPPRIDWDFNAISPRLINKAKRTINEAEKISEIIKTRLLQQQSPLIQRDIHYYFPKKPTTKHPSAQDSCSSKSKKYPRTEK